MRHGHHSEVADFGEKQDLVIEPDWLVEARMPTALERERLGMPRGWPVLHVIYPDETGDIYPAHLYRIRVRGSGGS